MALNTQEIAQDVRRKLYSLSASYLQESYIEEARYISDKWGIIFLNQSDPVRWSMAKDFEKKFPRHSYAEWSYVFGIPASNPVIQVGLQPAVTIQHRRKFAYRKVRFVLAGMLVVFATVPCLPVEFGSAVFLATLLVGLSRLSAAL